MRIEEKVLIIDEPMGDEEVEVILATLQQEGIERVEVHTHDLGAAVVQALLIHNRHKTVVFDDPVLQKIFENVQYVSVDS